MIWTYAPVHVKLVFEHVVPGVENLAAVLARGAVSVVLFDVGLVPPESGDGGVADLAVVHLVILLVGVHVYLVSGRFT